MNWEIVFSIVAGLAISGVIFFIVALIASVIFD